MTPVEARDLLISRLGRDLIGPGSEDEVLEGRRIKPSDVYLTGILWPLGDRLDGADDDGSSGDSEEEDGPSTPGLVGQQRPCTMGISFATESAKGGFAVSVHVEFATYTHEEVETVSGERVSRWTRKPFRHVIERLELSEGSPAPLPVAIDSLLPKVEIHVRGQKVGRILLVTITLINRSRPEEKERISNETHTLFQVNLKVCSVAGTTIIPRPGQRVALDEDEQIGRLLYRNCPEFAAGHQCSVGWTASKEGNYADEVFSNWIPSTDVPAVSPDGHEEFGTIAKDKLLVADDLVKCSDEELQRRLNGLADAYERWIGLQSKKIPGLKGDLHAIATQNLDVCRTVLSRIRAGIARVKRDTDLRLAFRLANQAMALQHSWKRDATQPLRWYPFQLGFILLALESVCDRNAPDRDILDLLWFPTGGGKTEAYLAILAILAFHRRLSTPKPDSMAGCAAVMRYTLRLLTAQQFERASALILTCDLIRRRLIKSALGTRDIGERPFSIGLWVGRDATPNNFEKALETKGQRDGSTAEQIDLCPSCQSKVRWNYNEANSRVSPYCESAECLLGPGYGLWPVFTVDTDIYRQRPTLLIGTVDKFANLPTRKETGDLLGFRTPDTPDLVIQDELHLISGPLGTIAGLYETAFDWLMRADGHRPKIIGSTATIRRASEQVLALFDRRSSQFPPPGLDHDDSGFAVRDREKTGRRYLGVTTAGRSAKFVLQAVVGTLLQSASAAAIPDPMERDGYATLLCYFNSLRELGGAIVQMLDDVPDSISLYARHRGEKPRPIKEPSELTSRVTQKEIVEILSALKRTARDPDVIDVVLATNMVSVGVDVSRLGLMVVNGQPKTRSEYIQATSRVGRSVFPGLVISVLNAAKPRDRSHFETFPGWHATLYRDVEATSVTPFASRARDRALHAVLVSMIRHGLAAMHASPKLANAPAAFLQQVVEEIERRIGKVDPRELVEAQREIDQRMNDWVARAPISYINPHQPNRSLLQSADRYAQRRAAGRATGSAWPTMNNMRSVEPTTRFRMTEVLTSGPRRPAAPGAAAGPAAGADGGDRPVPPWRRNG